MQHSGDDAWPSVSHQSVNSAVQSACRDNKPSSAVRSINQQEGEEPRLAATPPPQHLDPTGGEGGGGGGGGGGSPSAHSATSDCNTKPVRVAAWPLIGPDPDPSKHRQTDKQTDMWRLLVLRAPACSLVVSWLFPGCALAVLNKRWELCECAGSSVRRELAVPAVSSCSCVK